MKTGPSGRSPGMCSPIPGSIPSPCLRCGIGFSDLEVVGRGARRHRRSRTLLRCRADAGALRASRSSDGGARRPSSRLAPLSTPSRPSGTGFSSEQTRSIPFAVRPWRRRGASLRHAYNAMRRHFRFLVGRDVPRVKLAIATPEEVDVLYGDTSHAAAQRSRARRKRCRRSKYPEPLRRRSGRTSGCVSKARQGASATRSMPASMNRAGIADPPTIIFGHGICVEFDHWHGLIDECHALVQMGFRVIRPEAPWHGRRIAAWQLRRGTDHRRLSARLLDALPGAVRNGRCWRAGRGKRRAGRSCSGDRALGR